MGEGGWRVNHDFSYVGFYIFVKPGELSRKQSEKHLLFMIAQGSRMFGGSEVLWRLNNSTSILGKD